MCMENDDEFGSCDHRNRDIVIPSEGGVFSPTPDRVNDHSPIQKDEFRIEHTILLDGVTYQCYNNDAYEECVNSEEIIVKSDDLETLHSIYKGHKPSGKVHIPRIVSTTFQKIPNFGLELRASPVLLDYFASRDFSLPVHVSRIVSVPIPSEPLESVILSTDYISFAKPSVLAEFERTKQAKLIHSVLVSKAKSVSTSVLNTNPDGNIKLARTKLLNHGRIPLSSLPIPVCDALETSSEYVSHNKFNILGANYVGESSNNQLRDINMVDEVAKRAKQHQLIALQNRINALKDNDVMSDSEDETKLGIRARNGSSPRLKSSSNTSNQVKLNKPQNPKVHCSAAFGNRLQFEGFSSHVNHNATANSIANIWQLNSQDDVTPWLVMGDFNCILRLDDNKGADSLGTKFTWTNRQSDTDRIISKLDRAVINAAWLAKFENWRCKALPRPKRAPFRIQKMWFLHADFLRMQDPLRFESAALRSDENPSDITNFNLMKDAMSKLSETRLQHSTMLKQKSRNQWLVEGSSNYTFFHNSIRIRRSANTISELVDEADITISYYDQELDYELSLFDYEHPSILEVESLAMDRTPSPEEIKQVVFDLGADSAPGPDGFSGCFYRHCWDIIQDDLIKAITFCWDTGHIPNGINSSLIIFLPKVRGANTLCNFRPIGPSNFFFKIFTKILATRLGSVLDNLVFEEQVAFMEGRNIHENISLASEMVNELHLKRKDGNIGLKLGISQAFDTVSWAFVLEVFRRYGFSEQWCSWIHDILNSARISILLNGCPEGYFKINRGLRQRDPLSPLIFVLIGDVLSRNITKLFCDKKMSHMVTRGGISPTHIFFADDIMIFCKGNLKSLHNLVELLGKYQRDSGQTIKSQLAGWKGFSLSFHDRIVLVKSVIASYSIHNMAIYKWPRKFILQCERAIRNFIWTGDSNVSCAVVVVYDKVCCPFEEGGLGLDRMSTKNDSLIMKLWWNIRTSKKKRAGFLRAKFFGRNGCIKVKGVKSSILPGIKKIYKLVESNTRVFLGDGRTTSLYYDAWYSDRCFADILNDQSLDRNVLVSDFWLADHWEFPEVHMDRMLQAGVIATQLPIPNGGDDSRVWMPDYTCFFSVSSAKDLIRQRYSTFAGASLIWKKEVHPNLDAQNWKFLRGACATFDVIKSRFKIQLANKCSLCGLEEETLTHVLFHCSFAGRAWNWINDTFGLIANENLVISVKAAKGRSTMVRDLWLITNLVIRSELWVVRNKAVFEHQKANWSLFLKRVLKIIQEYVVCLKGCMKNCAGDVIILDYFRVHHRKVKFSEPIECFWKPPEEDEVQICCDGATRGNPGVAGAGVVARDAICSVLGAISIGFGITINYLAELYGIIVGMKWAVRWGFRRICIRYYSSSVVEALKNSNLPWFARQRWRAVSNHYDTIRFIHTYREANFSADAMAKRGCLLRMEEGLHHDGRPDFLLSVEYPNQNLLLCMYE
ncbi:uncharacterized protein LOC113356565 [Papaver somniferum]|uniref:uncharacterized protein LOC113356565 n=1 Tax=Papaver somniferum TaxID=3469 RepID=UPI000E6FA40A|nr:uncharacterized protein LOC113356565 [Papaver somniferum]